jgi:hypothetical protein
MSADPFRHSLVRVFLEEELGGKNPPDLSQAILEKVFGDEDSRSASVRAGGASSRRLVWRRWIVPAAAAAAIVIGLAVWMLMPAGYPDITISGDYQITSGEGLGRGAVIRTEDGSAVLEMGGYCRVNIEPWTTVRVDGADRNEQLFVEIGMVVCTVDSDVGLFSVRSELGSASVKGTKFTVYVEESGGRRQMRVQVAEGAVDVSNGSSHSMILAGRERTIVRAEAKQPETAAATKPTVNTAVGVDPVDPDVDSGFTSSSEDEGSDLREKIRACRNRMEKIESEIRILRQENIDLQKALDAAGPAPNNEIRLESKREGEGDRRREGEGRGDIAQLRRVLADISARLGRMERELAELRRVNANLRRELAARSGRTPRKSERRREREHKRVGDRRREGEGDRP